MYPLVDKSNYLKALLILAKSDKRLVEQEKNYIRVIADKLGFSSDFYEDVLKNLMINKHIKDNPIKFSDPSIAEEFLLDGFILSMKDSELSSKEQDWLLIIAEVNNIPKERFYQILEQCRRARPN